MNCELFEDGIDDEGNFCRMSDICNCNDKEVVHLEERALKPSELIQKFGDLPIKFLVYTCGRSSAHNLTSLDVTSKKGHILIQSDIN
jgi:hypothetical protein